MTQVRRQLWLIMETESSKAEFVTNCDTKQVA